MGPALNRADAARLLQLGGVVAIPTDTVYGLAARPDARAAIEAIFDLKHRPHDKPLPVLAASVRDLVGVAHFDETSLKLAERFWPGGLTMILPRGVRFQHDLGGGLPPTVAVRVPDSEVTLGLLEETGPLAVTSANPSGRPPATTAKETSAYFGEDFPVLDGGCTSGKASTTISLEGGLTVVRQGAISEEVLRQSLMS